MQEYKTEHMEYVLVSSTFFNYCKVFIPLKNCVLVMVTCLLSLTISMQNDVCSKFNA